MLEWVAISFSRTVDLERPVSKEQLRTSDVDKTGCQWPDRLQGFIHFHDNGHNSNTNSSLVLSTY